MHETAVLLQTCTEPCTVVCVYSSGTWGFVMLVCRGTLLTVHFEFSARVQMYAQSLPIAAKPVYLSRSARVSTQ